MSQNYIRLFYLQIILLWVVTVIYVVLANTIFINETNSCYISRLSAVIPYVYFHGREVCRIHGALPIISFYYLLSISIIAVAQYLYIRGRSKLSIANKPVFFGVLFVLLFAIISWIMGRYSSNALFNFKIHQSGAWGIYTIPVVVPSFQFILSVLMLQEEE